MVDMGELEKAFESQIKAQTGGGKMTEINFRDHNGMVHKWERPKRVTQSSGSSGKKLVPVSSPEILENYRKELAAIEHRLTNGKISSRAKRQRVLSQRNLLIEVLIPRIEERLGIKTAGPPLS